MIKDLSENELLDYLMTSEFQEGLKPDEFRYLLYTFRNYYRVAKGQITTLNNEIDIRNTTIDEIKITTEKIINQATLEKDIAKGMLNDLYNRKLTLKERLSGKIINKNEII